MTILKPRARAVYFMLALVTLACGTAIYPLFRGPDLLLWNIAPKPGFWGIRQLPYPKAVIASVLVGTEQDFL